MFYNIDHYLQSGISRLYLGLLGLAESLKNYSVTLNFKKDWLGDSLFLVSLSHRHSTPMPNEEFVAF